MHRLLKRQIRKHLRVDGEPPAELATLLDAIDRTYRAYDDDRKLIERSLDLSSAEMRALNEDLQARTRELEENLERVRAMQQQLIMQEKMAELGTLTAGIAHGIKNPLNFVNNFATLSIELLEELRAATASWRAALDDEEREETDELVELLTGNLGKILEHGTRADRIVRGMLMHSRDKSGDFRPTNLNKLLEEYLSLAFHTARAQDSALQVELQLETDPTLGRVDLIQADMARAFLNILGNAFYATRERARGEGAEYRAVVRVSTRAAGARVEVRIRDNGTGIPDALRARLFTPFFTTKPAGEGTGLGLSITHDIVVSVHRGSLAVDSVPGEYAEFIVSLPRVATRPLQT
ncbi:MAG: hypothetical protein H6713_40890 [Myxococcales bacterium]|nr:hypothetical protein [Myxococcales bacterium]